MGAGQVIALSNTLDHPQYAFRRICCCGNISPEFRGPHSFRIPAASGDEVPVLRLLNATTPCSTAHYSYHSLDTSGGFTTSQPPLTFDTSGKFNLQAPSLRIRSADTTGAIHRPNDLTVIRHCRLHRYDESARSPFWTSAHWTTIRPARRSLIS